MKKTKPYRILSEWQDLVKMTTSQYSIANSYDKTILKTMILDIGSGHKPDKKANILFEYSDAGDEHRWNKSLKVDRPIIFYNQKQFPFKKNAFRKSICKHVLEHVDDPVFFLKEVERISMGGYIETPSEIAELIFTPYDQHKWVINYIDDSLVIKKKTEHNISKFGRLFDFLGKSERGFENNFYWKRRALFFIEYYWNERIDFKIVSQSKDTELDLNSDQVLEKICKINFASARRNTNFQAKKCSLSEVLDFLEKNILTPCCMTSVYRKENAFCCTKCGRNFRIDGLRIDLSL
ncbi:MAG: hypothetical protein AAB628_02230 [Patescibacteria group bacterium]